MPRLATRRTTRPAPLAPKKKLKPRSLIFIRRTSVSDGARALKDKLKANAVPTLLTNVTAVARRVLVLNWGSTAALTAQVANTRVLNKPNVVAVARNKLLTFNALKAAGFANIPDFWTTAPTAEQRAKSIILERTADGQGGSGITIKRPDQPLGRAPMYVRYIPKEIELRVHVMNGKAIAVQQKRKVEGREQTDNEKLIRSHGNGWSFAVNAVDQAAAAAAKPVAVEACRLLGLDFGAVDIVIPKVTKANKNPAPVFLEVNTRPGLESDTVLSAYAAELKAMVAAA